MGLISRWVDWARGVPRADAPPPTTSGPSGPGVGATGGGWQNAMTGMGGPRDPATGTTFGYVTPLPDTLRDNLYCYEPMTGIIVDRPAEDMTRRGLNFCGFEGCETRRLQSKLDDLAWLDKIQTAISWCRKDGGSAIYLTVNDGRPHLAPIDYSHLNDLASLHVITRRELSVAQWNWDPTTKDFGEPLYYYLHTPGVHSAANLVHRDRVIPFVQGRLPHNERMRHSGWGISVIDRIWGPLRAKGAALSAVSSILTSYAVDVVKIKGLHEAMRLGSSKDLKERADLMRYTLGNLSKIFIDADGEDFTSLTRSAAGLAELVELHIDELQAASRMPKVILRGLGQSAALGTGEDAGAVRGYYDGLAGGQKYFVTRPATRIVDLVLRSRFGPTLGEGPEHWWLEPKALWEPDDTEKAAVRASNATARSTDMMSGVVTREELRTCPDLAERYELEDEEETDSVDVTLFPDGETPLSTAEAAAMFGRNPGSIRTMIASGAINSYKFNGRYVVSQQEILRAVKGGAAALQAAPAEPGAAA